MLHKPFKSTSGFLQPKVQIKFSISQASLDQLHTEVSTFNIQYFTLYIFIQFKKVHLT